jgi:hypothetical protein
MKLILSSIIILFFTSFSFGQIESVAVKSDSAHYSTFELGVRCKKFVGFYWENGISGELNSPKGLKNKLSLGFNIASSKLGSGITGYEIPTFAAEVSLIKYLRDSKKLKPFFRLNVGYAYANYGSDEFSSIPNSATLLSLESGISYALPFSLRLVASGGYNIINGNGLKGLGTVYPFYGQFSIFYKLK